MDVEIIAYTVPVSKKYGATVAEFVAYVARISNPPYQSNHLTSEKLLKYLQKSHHWSPFEMASVVMEIKTTRDIDRQILRHRSFSFQEFSQRYAEVTEPLVLREARLQDTRNRQNSVETNNYILAKDWEIRQRNVVSVSLQTYNWALENGIAKEQARTVLPEGLTPSTIIMSGTLRSWIHYIQLHSDSATQKEHREIAVACNEQMKTIGINNILENV